MKRWLPVALLTLLYSTVQAATGLAELPGIDGDGPVTVFYPSSAEARPLKRGPFAPIAAFFLKHLLP